MAKVATAARKAAAPPKIEWPADQVERRPIGELLPYARNARVHSDAQIAQIAASIREWGWTIPVLVDEAGVLIAGHGRILAARQLQIDTVPVMTARGWSEAKIRAYRIADNKLGLNSGWDDELLGLELADLGDFDVALTGFSADEMAGMFGGDSAEGDAALPTVSLADRFMVPPFSVLNAREGWWQARKAAWIALGIQSELGRGGNLIGRSIFERCSMLLSGVLGNGGTGRAYDAVRAWVLERRERGLDEQAIEAEAHELSGRRPSAIPGGGGGKGAWLRTDGQGYKAVEKGGFRPAFNTQDLLNDIDDGSPRAATGTSIFDPVLCEIAYRWFCPPDGLVFDPFAGGSVRGILAAKLGRRYTGIDLSAEQIGANEGQLTILGEGDHRPQWLCGDSGDIATLCPDLAADFLFSCPPYADLERYSDDPRDLSTMAYADFLAAYRRIIAAACARLKPDRFACFVVGEVRGDDGNYRGLIPDTIRAFTDAGVALYNEAILVTAVGSLPVRVGRMFEASRKLGKTHQNVLVFVKGDARAATEAIGPVEFADPIEAAPSGVGERIEYERSEAVA